MKRLPVLGRSRAAIALCLALAAACGREEQPESERAASSAVPDSATRSDTTFTPEPERVSLPADRIYYTLTEHAWYARGEPLVHDGRPYAPAGMPVSASLPEMERVGDYQGVDYYRRAGDDSMLYVPVYRGYWQVFRADAATR